MSSPSRTTCPEGAFHMLPPSIEGRAERRRLRLLLSMRFRRRPRAATAAPPRLPLVGESVSVLPRRWSRGSLQARVLAQRPRALVVQLQARPRLWRRSPLVLEWADAEGLARLCGRVRLLGQGPEPVLEVRCRKPPELIQRRRHVRAQAELAARAWSLLDPTRLGFGTTVDVSGAGALIQLPNLPLAATAVDLHLTLPDGLLTTRARVVRRAEPDLVAVAFEGLRPEDEERLVAFVAQVRASGPPTPVPGDVSLETV